MTNTTANIEPTDLPIDDESAEQEAYEIMQEEYDDAQDDSDDSDDSDD